MNELLNIRDFGTMHFVLLSILNEIIVKPVKENKALRLSVLNLFL